jgi:hypothetical protein
MAEALAAIGLASSIMTFIDFSIEFGKLVRSISQSQGSLPKELEECHKYIDIVAIWLEDVKRSIQPVSDTVDENHHLDEAIQRCSQTVTELLILIESLSNGSIPDENVSRIQKTRGTLRSIKRAGKIMWKRERIVEIRDKLRTNRDEVHLYISSRTGRQVTKLLYYRLHSNCEALTDIHNLGKDNPSLTGAYSSLIGRLFTVLGISKIFDFKMSSYLCRTI